MKEDSVALPCSRTKTLLWLAVAACGVARAETGAEAWLRYAPIANPAAYAWLPSRIVLMGTSPTDLAAG